MYLTSYSVGDDLSFCDKSFSGRKNLGGTLNTHKICIHTYIHTYIRKFMYGICPDGWMLCAALVAPLMSFLLPSCIMHYCYIRRWQRGK